MGLGIIGAGKALGSRIETNDALAFDTIDGWIVEKTGIKQRYKADGETTSSLALEAARNALQHAGILPASVGMIVVCTFVNDYLFPSLALRLNRDLGCVAEQAYDLQANCSGFLSALVTVTDRMRADPFIENALIVGAEVLSPYIDPTDINTAPFFSDGAGAVVIGRTSSKGLVSSAFATDTSAYEAVRCLPHGTITQNGIITWKQAVQHLPGTIRNAVERAGWALDEVDLFIPHQANLVLLKFLASRLGWGDRTFTNVETTGNTGAASIAIAISDAYEAGRLHPGMKVVLAGIGAGFSFAAAGVEW
jgi:3-oxoacyl-[acyl-carrier-protein] synthase III